MELATQVFQFIPVDNITLSKSMDQNKKKQQYMDYTTDVNHNLVNQNKIK